MFYHRKHPQAGFTLIEILVALALITLLAVGISLAFDGSRSRAQALLSNMTELGAANVRLKNDTGCYVSVPGALVDPNLAASTANNYCSRSLANTWNGPYVAPFATDAANNVKLDKVADGVTVGFGQQAGGAYGANGSQYYVIANSVPADVVKQAFTECNGQVNAGNKFTGYKCDGDPTNGTFEILFDETR
jgi:prepilin-type N-terminal cleavage/methylation domain-containing protein